MNKIDGISIIICCFNSSKRLEQTLSHIAMQTLPFEIRENCEIVLVDNCSTDNTKDIANKLWGQLKCNIPLILVEEYRPGLSYARAKGIKTAKYEYLIFCDDDNWLQNDYVDRAYSIMNTNKKIGVLGGKSYPIYEQDPPNWFVERGNYFAIGIQALTTGDVTNTKGYVWGAGSVYRKQVFEKINDIGYKPVLTGRKGNKMTTGEDVELCMVAKKIGYQIWYDENLICGHYMPASRFSEKKFYELCIANGFCYPLFSVYNNSLSFSYSGLLKRGLYLLRSIPKLYYFNLQEKKVSKIKIHYYEAVGELRGIIFFTRNYRTVNRTVSTFKSV